MDYAISTIRSNFLERTKKKKWQTLLPGSAWILPGGFVLTRRGNIPPDKSRTLN